ncbi:DUF3392 domain-containing protein [bacterium]|nr:DUF3392 domain-containing protein [bacterium]
MNDTFLSLSNWMRPYVYQISLALVTTLAVIYSSSINRSIRRQIRGLHFFMRTLIFVFVCTFGYGAAIVFVTPHISDMLRSLDRNWLAPIVVLSFLLLGVLGEKNKQM